MQSNHAFPFITAHGQLVKNPRPCRPWRDQTNPPNMQRRDEGLRRGEAATGYHPDAPVTQNSLDLDIHEKILGIPQVRF